MTAMAAEAGREVTDPSGLVFLIEPALVREQEAQALAAGKWEGNERELVRAHLRPGERVLELGACIGAVSMTIARVVGPGNLMALEPNPAALGLARRNAARNGLDIAFRHGIALNRRQIAAQGRRAAFHVAPSLVSSALAPMPRGQPVEVPALCLEALVAQHGATTLVADIEGAEVDLLRGARLSPLRRIILETHYRKAGRAAVNAMMRDLYAQGFCVDLSTCRGEVMLLHRGLEPE